MNFNKKKGVSTVAIIIFLAIFNTAAFLLPLKHTLTFWIGYSFAVLSAAILLACLLFLFDSQHKERMFLRLPLAKLGWAYFVLQIMFCFWEISGISITYLSALVINSCLTGFYIIAILASTVAGESIEKQDSYIAQKVFFIKNMQAIVSQIKTPDENLARRLKSLQDEIRFSDPMSHSMLEEIEKQIEAKVVMLKSEINNKGKATESIECISDLLKERNQKCKLYKNVTDDKYDNTDKDNSGVKYVAITIGVLGALLIAALISCFIIIPNNTYRTAMSLYNNRQYAKALVTFEGLGTFRNSDEMAETIKQTIIENKYIQAEDCFKNQDYVDAMQIYNELGDYKDCKQKIEQIQNRLATDEAIYYGTYQNNPIAWRAIKTEDNRMLLIAKEAICELPYNNEIKDVTWQNSSLFSWLNNDFIGSFSKDQLSNISTTKVDGADCKIFLLSKEEADNLKDTSVLTAETDWWLRTKSDVNALYVKSSGEIVEDGETVVRAKGVRPCIWIDLK